MNRSLLVVIACALVWAPNAAVAQNPALCKGLTGAARTQCLRDERDRHAADAAYWAAYSASLTKSMKKACDAADAADFAAQILAEGREPRVKWGGRTWMSARLLADAALGQHKECERLRAELKRRR